MPGDGIAPQRVDAAQQQRESNGRQNVGRRREGVALPSILGLPRIAAVVMVGVLMAGVFVRRRGGLGGGISGAAFVGLGLQDEWNGAEKLGRRDCRADEKASHNR